MITARILLVAALAAAGGCYDPALRDCTVTCTAPSDCADGQTCGSAGLCIGAGETTCPAKGERPDAAITPSLDAMKAHPDAPIVPTVMLHLTVNGKGGVVVDNGSAMTCTVVAGNNADCTYEISANVEHQLVAAPQPGRMFMMWMGACNGNATTCTLIPTADFTVGAMFNN